MLPVCADGLDKGIHLPTVECRWYSLVVSPEPCFRQSKRPINRQCQPGLLSVRRRAERPGYNTLRSKGSTVGRAPPAVACSAFSKFLCSQGRLHVDIYALPAIDLLSITVQRLRLDLL